MQFKFTVLAESEEEVKTKEDEMLNFLKEHEANLASLSKEKKVMMMMMIMIHANNRVHDRIFHV